MISRGVREGVWKEKTDFSIRNERRQKAVRFFFFLFFFYPSYSFQTPTKKAEQKKAWNDECASRAHTSLFHILTILLNRRYNRVH